MEILKRPYTIEEIKGMITPDNPVIECVVMIPFNCIVEEIESFEDFYDKLDDKVCDSYLPKVDSSYSIFGVEQYDGCLWCHVYFKVRIELDYEIIEELY